MRRFSRLWWASLLLSSVVTGGGSFLLLTLLTAWPILTVIKVSVALAVVGDVVLALLMEAESPSPVIVGPGERWGRSESPKDLGAAIHDFANGRGAVSIRGETWQARQSPECRSRLEAGAAVRVLRREGLTLVVAAANGVVAAANGVGPRSARPTR